MKQLKLKLTNRTIPLTATAVFDLVRDREMGAKAFHKWLKGLKQRSYVSGFNEGESFGSTTQKQHVNRVQVRNNY